MKPLSVVFTEPRQVAIEEQRPLPPPAAGEVVVETAVSAISAGTELLVFRGQVARDLGRDETLPGLAGDFRFPLKYGYSAVGRVIGWGPEVEPIWRDRAVFAFHPHQSHFLAKIEDLIPVPASVPLETAALLPNMETAVSFVMDGAPIIGERVAVFGQGVVGLLTTLLLAHLPLALLVTLDGHPLRRRFSSELGARVCLDPGLEETRDRLAQLFEGEGPYRGADLTYELSGDPWTLDQAIAATGYNGRVVVGSWYGTKRAELDLGGRFHRSAMTLKSSQVSRLAPRWRGRWNHRRRLAVAWDALERHGPAPLITHRFPFEEAAQAYRLLDETPAAAVQVILDYKNPGTAAAS